MQFSASLVLAVLAAVARAVQFDFGPEGFAPQAGQPITLNWSGATGPVTITLKDGSSDDLQDVEVLVSGSTSGSYTWTPGDNLPAGTYALEISDGTETNFSPQFNLDGDAPAPTTSASETISMTTSEASETETSSESMTSDTTSTIMTSMNTTMTTSTSETTSETTTDRDEATTTREAPTDAATTEPADINGSQRLASSLALVVGAFAAIVAFN